jgi:hypothetical protein
MNKNGVESYQVPTEQIVEQVAARKGVDPTSLTTPLFDVVDTDALNQLVASGHGGGSGLEVTFSYDRYDVRVTATGAVSLTKR